MLMYGRGEQSIADQLGISLEEAIDLKNSVYQALPKLKKLESDLFKQVEEKGYVMTMWGYKRRLPNFNLPDYEVFYYKGKTEKPVKVPPIVEERYVYEYSRLRYNKREEYISNLLEKERILFKDNRSKKSEAGRQVLNSLIQGCESGECSVLSKQYGYQPIKSFVNKGNVVLWDGYDWTNCWVAYSGKKRLVRITFHDGTIFECSPDHKFLTIGTSGAEKFLKAEELKKNYRVLTTLTPEITDKLYVSERRDYSMSTSKNEYYLDDLLKHFDNRFEVGQFIGRLMSDGYITQESSGNRLSWLVAEHEFDDILPLLNKMGAVWNKEVKIDALRENRTQRIGRLDVSSRSLADECRRLNLKNEIPDVFFEDTEMLRGILSGIFDGDGCVTNSINIHLGGHKDYMPFLKGIQKALKIFGIRSRVRKNGDGSHVLSIMSYDNSLFAENIGFINKVKQEKALNLKAIKQNKSFKGKRFLVVKNVEITDEYIDMYDVMDTERGYFMTEGIITHNSSANMTKKALILMHNNEELKQYGCYPLIPVHDEIIATSPYRYSRIASELFIKDMEDAPKDKLDVEIKCDAEVFFNWAGESIEFLPTEDLKDCVDKLC